MSRRININILVSVRGGVGVVLGNKEIGVGMENKCFFNRGSTKREWEHDQTLAVQSPHS